MPRLRENELVTASLLRRFQLEAQLAGVSEEFYALIQRDSGDFLSHHPFGPAAAVEQIMWATDVLRRLNRELHHDGAWVVVFTDPKPPQAGELAVMNTAGHREYARYALLWLDHDADVQFAVEWVMNESELLDWCDVLLAGIESVMQKCETAWEIWRHHNREVLDPADGQTYARAKGQQASSARH